MPKFRTFQGLNFFLPFSGPVGILPRLSGLTLAAQMLKTHISAPSYRLTWFWQEP